MTEFIREPTNPIEAMKHRFISEVTRVMRHNGDSLTSLEMSEMATLLGISWSPARITMQIKTGVMQRMLGFPIETFSYGKFKIYYDGERELRQVNMINSIKRIRERQVENLALRKFPVIPLHENQE